MSDERFPYQQYSSKTVEKWEKRENFLIEDEEKCRARHFSVESDHHLIQSSGRVKWSWMEAWIIMIDSLN